MKTKEQKEDYEVWKDSDYEEYLRPNFLRWKNMPTKEQFDETIRRTLYGNNKATKQNSEATSGTKRPV